MRDVFNWRSTLLTLALAWGLHCGVGSAAEILSVGSAGVVPFAKSASPSISGNGRFVVFTTTAKLSPEDVNSQVDVYVHDRQTKATRLVSDSRGGDQPMISANGRFVVYRGLEEFPQVKYVDLQGTEQPKTISYIFNGVGSQRSGDLGSVTPDGHFALFAFRPTPFGTSDTKLCIVDATASENNRLNAGFAITSDLLLSTLGRSATRRDGNLFFFETRDGVASLDKGTQTNDIYKMDRAGNFLRISATEGNPDESNLTAKDSAHDPALSSNGDTIFFISERPLRSSDPGPGSTIYRSTSADGFAVPVAIATPGVSPLALSAQATADGKFLVFLGRSARGVQAGYILRLSDNKLQALAPATEAPSISANNAAITLSTPVSLLPQDHNGLSDVYLVPNPFPNAGLQAPTVTLTASQTGEIVQGTAVSLSANATSANNGFFYTAIEVDGVEVRRVNDDGTVPAQNYTLARGIHKVRAVCIDGANVPGQSAEVQISVKPVANSVLIRGITDLERRGDAAGGAVSFSATAHIDNTFATVRGPVQLVITEAPADTKWELFGNDVDAAVRDENVLAVYDLPSIAANTMVDQAVDGVTLPPEVLGGQHFRGVGWVILAKLREQVSGTWSTRDTTTLFTLRPRLDEDTPGPNGGVPVVGSFTSDPNFNPALLQAVNIVGANSIAAGSSRIYKAEAVFNPGAKSKPCTPKWSVQASGVAAFVSPQGQLFVGGVSAPKTIVLQAVFGTKSKTMPIVVTPVSPVVSVRTIAPLLDENGGTGGFRILRSPATSSPLTVNYEISGHAQPGQDFQALTGTAVIPGGKGAVDVPVVPLNDNFADGRLDIVLTLDPSGDYRLRPNHSATLQIEDDEPPAQTQPDAMLRRGTKTVGERVFRFDGTAQQLTVKTGRGTPVSFQLIFSNPTSASENLVVTGADDFLGFSVRYFQGRDEVTSDVVGSGFAIPGVPAGGSTKLTLKITPTAATPLLGTMQCPVTVRANDARGDTVQAVVQRVR